MEINVVPFLVLPTLGLNIKEIVNLVLYAGEWDPSLIGGQVIG